MQLGTDRPDAPAVKARSRRGLGQGRWKMTSEHPWRLQDLEYEPAGGGRERATIDGVEIVRVNGKYSITFPYGQWRDKDEKEVGICGFALSIPQTRLGAITNGLAPFPRHHSQASAVLDSSCTQPQGDGCARLASAGGTVGGENAIS